MRPRVNLRATLGSSTTRSGRLEPTSSQTDITIPPTNLHPNLNQTTFEFRPAQEQNTNIPLVSSRSLRNTTPSKRYDLNATATTIPPAAQSADLNQSQLLQQTLLLHDTTATTTPLNTTILDTTTTTVPGISRIPQPQGPSDGEVVDLFVTVNGITIENAPQTLPLFYNIGSVLNKHFIHGGRVVLEYISPSEAREALKLDGLTIDNTIIAVRPTNFSTDLTEDLIAELEYRYPDLQINPQQQQQDGTMTAPALSGSIINRSLLSPLKNLARSGQLDVTQHNASLNGTLNTSSRSVNSNNDVGKMTTMAVRSPNLLQRRVQPNQPLVCLDPFDLDNARLSGPKGLATYEEYVRNRGCWSKFCAWFSSE